MDLSSIEGPFSLEEIRKATFDLWADKALSPDGFPIFFFQKFWDVVKYDLAKLSEDLYVGKGNLEWINWASIVLILKMETPDSPSNFRLVNLINSFLKIVSKILVARLSKIIDSLVDVSQFAFIKGRCILDNIAMAKELIFSLQKCRLPGNVFKVDFPKAFDMIDWDFLLEMFTACGFGMR